jgi:hypothetical protein
MATQGRSTDLGGILGWNQNSVMLAKQGKKELTMYKVQRQGAARPGMKCDLDSNSPVTFLHFIFTVLCICFYLLCLHAD